MLVLPLLIRGIGTFLLSVYFIACTYDGSRIVIGILLSFGPNGKTIESSQNLLPLPDKHPLSNRAKPPPISSSGSSFSGISSGDGHVPWHPALPLVGPPYVTVNYVMNLVEGLRTEQESYLREGSAVEGNLEEAGEIEGKGLSGWDELMERWGVVLSNGLDSIRPVKESLSTWLNSLSDEGFPKALLEIGSRIWEKFHSFLHSVNLQALQHDLVSSSPRIFTSLFNTGNSSALEALKVVAAAIRNSISLPVFTYINTIHNHITGKDTQGGLGPARIRSWTGDVTDYVSPLIWSSTNTNLILNSTASNFRKVKPFDDPPALGQYAVGLKATSAEDVCLAAAADGRLCRVITYSQVVDGRIIRSSWVISEGVICLLSLFTLFALLLIFGIRLTRSHLRVGQVGPLSPVNKIIPTRTRTHIPLSRIMPLLRAVLIALAEGYLTSLNPTDLTLPPSYFSFPIKVVHETYQDTFVPVCEWVESVLSSNWEWAWLSGIPMPIIMFGAVRWWKSRREEKRTKPGKKADVDEEEDKPVRIIANVISPAPMRQGDKDGGGDAGPASTPPKIDTSPEWPIIDIDIDIAAEEVERTPSKTVSDLVPIVEASTPDSARDEEPSLDLETPGISVADILTATTPPEALTESSSTWDSPSVVTPSPRKSGKSLEGRKNSTENYEFHSSPFLPHSSSTPSLAKGRLGNGEVAPLFSPTHSISSYPGWGSPVKRGLSSIGDGDGGAGGSEVGEGLFGTMRRTTTSLDLGAVAKAAVGEVEGGFETGNEEHKDDDEDVFGSVRAGPIAGAEANSFVEPKEEAVKGCTAVENAAREEAVVGEESSCSSSFSVSASASSPAEAAVAVVDVVTADKNESLVKTRPVILEKPSAVEVKKTTSPALPATPAKVPGLSNFAAKALIKSPSPVEPAKTGPSSSFRTPKEIPVANDGSWIPVRKRMGKALRKPVADSLSPVPPGPPHHGKVFTRSKHEAPKAPAGSPAAAPNNIGRCALVEVATYSEDATNRPSRIPVFARPASAVDSNPNRSFHRLTASLAPQTLGSVAATFKRKKSKTSSRL